MEATHETAVAETKRRMDAVANPLIAQAFRHEMLALAVHLHAGRKTDGQTVIETAEAFRKYVVGL